jgi:hypothetical protein
MPNMTGQTALGRLFGADATETPNYDNVPAASRERLAALLLERQQAQQAMAIRQSQGAAADQMYGRGLMAPNGAQTLREEDQNGAPVAAPAFAPGMQVPQAQPQLPDITAAAIRARMAQNPDLMNFQTPDNMRSGPGAQ